MSINRTDKTSGMDDMGDEQFAAMYCKASTYFPKPLNNTERKKKSILLKENRPEIKTHDQRAWARKKVRVGSLRDLHIADRVDRIVFSLKDDNIIINGKYKRATFMGLPSEIQDRIMYFHFRGMRCDAKDPGHSYDFLTPSLHLSHSTLRPQIDMTVRIPHPLALLHTWGGIYDEAVKIFQRNALFVSEYQPIDGTEDVPSMLDVFGPHGNVPKMWPNVKRWHLRIIPPDQGKLWGCKPFPFHHPREMVVLLPHRVRQHLKVAFKDGNVLDELIVDIGEEIIPSEARWCKLGPIYSPSWSPNWALDFSRYFILSGLRHLKGKVKKVSIRLQGLADPDLRANALLIEMYVAGCKIEDLHEFWDQYKAHKKNELEEDSSSENTYSEGGTESGDDMADIHDVTAHSNLLPADNYISNQLTGINDESALQNPFNDLQSTVHELDEFIERHNNVNPWYDGPEDDGLDWLDSEGAFDVDASERLVGEVELEKYDCWAAQPCESLEVAISPR